MAAQFLIDPDLLKHYEKHPEEVETLPREGREYVRGLLGLNTRSGWREEMEEALGPLPDAAQ